MILTSITMVTKRFEITLTDPLTQAEFEWFELKATDEDADAAMTNNGRILMVDGLEDIYQLISLLSEHEFIHDIGLIKEVIDYEPQFDDEDMHYLIDFDND